MPPVAENRVVVRGAGEMASGVIRRLALAGFQVIALEKPAPSCVRRYVCYAEAFFQEQTKVEEITAVLVSSAGEAVATAVDRQVSLLIDPLADSLSALSPLAVIDGRMLKENIDSNPDLAPIVIGLGPGFVSRRNCHAAVETSKGVNLGRVFFTGHPQADTGVPSEINGFGRQRVLRSPADGEFHSPCRITDIIQSGQVLGEVTGVSVVSEISGMVRGLIHDGLTVSLGQKIGDVDPRCIRDRCYRISEKADAIGNGALKALTVLSQRLLQH